MTTKKKAPRPEIYNTITNCNFVGVQYDAKAVDAIITIASGLKSNADALGKLAEVMRASNVHLDCMLKVEASK